MSKATARSTTTPPRALNRTIDLPGVLEPIGCEWAAPGKARITLRAASGQIFVTTMTTPMLVKTINMAVDLINSRLSPIMDGDDDIERIAVAGG